MKFSYVAFDAGGKRVEDLIEANSEAIARQQISEKGLYIASISSGAAAAAIDKAPQASGGRKQPKWRCLAEFTRQMAILISTGTPVVQALGAVERQVTDPRFRAVMADVRQRVEQGQTLSEAVAGHPKYFDAVARSLIAAGESSGKLDSMLQRLAAVNRQQEVVRRSLTAALAYPAMLTTIALIVMVSMLMFVVPRFAVLFENLDTPVPPSTAVLMDVSGFLRASWWWFFPTVLCGTTGGVVWGMSRSGRRTIDRWLLIAPGFSKLVTSLALARIARVLGVLVESRVPLLDALVLAKQSVNNESFKALLESVKDTIVRGGSMSSVIVRSPLVTPAFAEAIRSGEETARVGEVLTSLADYLDEDNSVLLKSVTQMLEPIVLVLLGLVVGTIAVSMFLPLFDATAATGPAGGAH